MQRGRCEAIGSDASEMVSGVTVMECSEVVVNTQPGISIFDITPEIRSVIDGMGVKEGCVTVLSRHTTTAVTINENESRLLDDVRRFLL